MKFHRFKLWLVIKIIGGLMVMRIGLEEEGQLRRLNRSIPHIEKVIQEYGSRKGIANPMQWFAEQLGYKARNYLYKLFSRRDIDDIKVGDIKKIIHITGDITLADIVY